MGDELKAGQWFYPHNKYENLTPMSPHFCPYWNTKPSLCDKYLSARYIAKYAAGVEEKAQVLISAGSTENKLLVHLGDIENNKLQVFQKKTEFTEENRPGMKLTKSRRTLATTRLTVRISLPSWRQFTASQKRIIEMNVESNISTSNITAHSARPPELLFVTNPKQYFYLFERLPVKSLEARKLQAMLSEIMHWIDGFGKQVLIR